MADGRLPVVTETGVIALRVKVWEGVALVAVTPLEAVTVIVREEKAEETDPLSRPLVERRRPVGKVPEDKEKVGAGVPEAAKVWAKGTPTITGLVGAALVIEAGDW
jgi:hypothetical protein